MLFDEEEKNNKAKVMKKGNIDNVNINNNKSNKGHFKINK